MTELYRLFALRSARHECGNAWTASGPSPDERPRPTGLFPGCSDCAVLACVRLISDKSAASLRMLPWVSVDPIDEAWTRVESNWGDEGAHRRFVGVCVALGRLPEAGKRYRRIRDVDPARSEEAARHIDRLIALATQQLEDTRVVPATTEHKRTLTWAAFFIMLVLMGAGAWLLLRV